MVSWLIVRNQIEKVFDVACTLTDVISCVPFEPTSFEVGPSGYLQQFLNLISSLRGGRTRFLPLLLAKVSETLPSVITPTFQSPVTGLQDNFVSSLPSSGTTTPFDTPINPLNPINPIPPPLVTPPATQNLPYQDLLPSVQGTRYNNPFPETKAENPIPRSVPRLPLDEFYG